jgi:hypothetical protein
METWKEIRFDFDEVDRLDVTEPETAGARGSGR